MADLQITSEGLLHVRTFLNAQRELTNAKQAVSSAECALSNAERALAKWLAPADIKPGEKIGVWVNDSLFTVEAVQVPTWSAGQEGPTVTELKVSIRTRGKHHSLL